MIRRVSITRVGGTYTLLYTGERRPQHTVSAKLPELPGLVHGMTLFRMKGELRIQRRTGDGTLVTFVVKDVETTRESLLAIETQAAKDRVAEVIDG